MSYFPDEPDDADDPGEGFEWGEPDEIGRLNRMSGLLMLLDVLLPNRAESVSVARKAIRLAAMIWDVRPDLTEPIELLTSELFTNATKYGIAEGADPEKEPARLFVFRKGDRLRVEVHDSTPEMPRLRPTSIRDETGRGCLLVAMLSIDNGSYRTASGKAVWFELVAWPDDHLPSWPS
jgi:anti-sigma regulatory factor (Ser/Thr protein kinase)